MGIITKIKNRSIWLLSFPVDWYYRIVFKKPDIRTIEETIDTIIDKKASVSRYGDGELDIMAGRDIPFQKYSPLLALKNRL